MAYRFIDTGFYRSPFVRDLKGTLKSLYGYIITDCSNAGIWTVDLPIACIYIDAKIEFTEIENSFLNTGKAIDLNNGKWFFPDFIEHQYPKGLSRNNPAHNNIILELKKYNLIDENLKIIKVPQKGQDSPLEGTKVMVMVKDKVMEEERVMGKETESGPKNPNYQKCLSIYFDFIKTKTGVPPKINGAEGKSLKELIAYFETIVIDKTDPDAVPKAFEYLFSHWQKLEPFLQGQLTLKQINSSITNILNQIKNGKPTGKPTFEQKLAANLKQAGINTAII